MGIERPILFGLGITSSGVALAVLAQIMQAYGIEIPENDFLDSAATMQKRAEFIMLAGAFGVFSLIALAVAGVGHIDDLKHHDEHH